MNVLSKEQLNDISLAIGGGNCSNALILYVNLLLVENRARDKLILFISLHKMNNILNLSYGKLTTESKEVIELRTALMIADYKFEFNRIDFIEHLTIIL